MFEFNHSTHKYEYEPSETSPMALVSVHYVSRFELLVKCLETLTLMRVPHFVDGTLHNGWNLHIWESDKHGASDTYSIISEMLRVN